MSTQSANSNKSKSILREELKRAVDTCLYQGRVNRPEQLVSAFQEQFNVPFKRYYFSKMEDGEENRPELLLINRQCINIKMEGLVPVLGLVVCAAITDPYTEVEHDLGVVYDKLDKEYTPHLEEALVARRNLFQTSDLDPATAFVFK